MNEKNLGKSKENPLPASVIESIRNDIIPTMEIWKATLSIYLTQKNTKHLKDGIEYLSDSVDICLHVMRTTCHLEENQDFKSKSYIGSTIDKAELIITKINPVFEKLMGTLDGVNQAPSLNAERDRYFLASCENIHSSCEIIGGTK